MNLLTIYSKFIKIFNENLSAVKNKYNLWNIRVKNKF